MIYLLPTCQSDLLWAYWRRPVVSKLAGQHEAYDAARSINNNNNLILAQIGGSGDFIAGSLTCIGDIAFIFLVACKRYAANHD